MMTPRHRWRFYTPIPVVRMMIETSRHWDSCRALEPSAGDGRIVWELLQHGIKNVDACELDEAMRDRCRELGANIVGSDFLSYEPEQPYDLIVMNPPFTKKQDVRHIEHAYSMLAPDGELVAIAPTSFAEYLWGTKGLAGCEYAVYESLEKAFKESGTNVDVLLVTIRKPRVFDFANDDSVNGFCNGATNNAALSISSSKEWFSDGEACRTPDELRQKFAKRIGDEGGSVHGVWWQEVLDYLIEISRPEPVDCGTGVAACSIQSPKSSVPALPDHRQPVLF